VIQDSLSSGNNWGPYPGTLTVAGNVKIFARTLLNGTVSPVSEADFAFPPSLVDTVTKDTASTAKVTISAPGSDSIRVSSDNLNWVSLKSGATYAMTASGTLQAFAMTGGTNSSTISLAVSLFQRPPTITAGGIFPVAQTVSITSPNGAAIRYTTDGTAPTGSSQLYTDPFPVGATQTIKAIAVKTGYVNSAPSTATFAIADTTTYDIPWNSAITYGAVQDSRDGQVYRTVAIGSQTWMAQNLNYTVAGSSCVVNTVTGPDTCKKYGRLYSWPAALNLPLADTSIYSVATYSTSINYQGVCPTGWHIASETEWATLSNTVDPNAEQQDVLRSTNGWICTGRECTGGNGSDKFGFRALATESYETHWWTPTESDATTAVPVYLLFNSGVSSVTPLYKTFVYPVRCLKN
jgi:uncharacterized protein (TIGR02145 family)